MRPSLTAIYRFMALWPEKSIEAEFYGSKRLGKRMKKRIRARMKPRHSRLFDRWNGLFMCVSKGGVVFITTPKHFVIDVMPLEPVDATVTKA